MSLFDYMPSYYYLIPAVCGIVALLLLGVYRLKYPARQYKKENGIAYVKHGRGDWMPLLEHLKRKHPGEYAMLEKLKQEVNNGKQS